MTLRDQLTADLAAAMKAKDEVRVSTLRMLKAAVMKYEVSGSQKKEADDETIQSIIQKEIKQRKDAMEAFAKGGKHDMAAQEEAEMEILKSYMPEQMSEEELKKVVDEVIKNTGATSKADFGKVMGAVMGKVKGRADGTAVSKLVGQSLK
ncbi:aspartyl-tRNA amidotransferase [Candidatus Peregrinibacteria bacterium CG11_big_fil_rev_8_21_14_0_20_46_8]|nr:MAG: aspartyl-tRNA amidotransferase [Candidatus Peregrinibacteria bacterium CG11_big_fil_rev_8_21_14_0_20_46_8]